MQTILKYILLQDIFPFELILSRPPKLAIIQQEQPKSSSSSLILSEVDNLRFSFLRRLRTLVTDTQNSIRRAGVRYQKTAANNSRKLHSDRIVDKLVWTQAERNSDKLQTKLEGPHRVIGERNDYVILDTAGSGTRTVSKERVVEVPESDHGVETHDRATNGEIEYVIKNIVDVDNDDKGHVVYRIRW
jgi:hypothetical protein